MKYKIIKDSDKFRLLDSDQFIYYPGLPNSNESKKSNKIIKTSRGVIRTKILTDGQIKSITNLDSKEFILPNHITNSESDVNEVKELELMNHNYVIRVLIEHELRKINNGYGLVENIKDIEVYIKDNKNKEALKNIKDTLDLIYGPKTKSNRKDISYKKVNSNVYELVKKKRN